MYKKILVPFDDSESSHRALQNALQLVDGIDNAQVTVLKVVEWHDYNAETFKIASRMSGVQGDAFDMTAITEISDEAENEEIKRIRERISNSIKGFSNIEIAIVNGSPHDTIVAYASDLDYDCIVMGHRGMGVIRGVLGSVAYSVLQKTTKPVLVVK